MTSSLPELRRRDAMAGIQTTDPAGYFLAVDGTVYPGAPGPPPPGGGFSSDMAYGLMQQADGLWRHEFIGYPAAITPMWPSVQIGRANTVASIKRIADAYHNAHGTYAGLWIILSGYSQGAMVTNQVWVKDILAVDGVLHYLQGCIARIYNYGDIFRTPGIAHGNELANLPMPSKLYGATTGGIGGVMDLRANETNVPSLLDGKPVVVSCALDGDIYACCAVGDDPWNNEAAAGSVGTTFFKIIMQATFIDLVSVAKIVKTPVGDIQEMIAGLKFAVAGVNAPHWQYWDHMAACIGEMVDLGNRIVASR